MPNTFAYLMLFAWPFVVLVLFKTLPLRTALIWSILGGFLVLPVKTEVDLPLIPALDKVLIPSLAAAAMCLSLPGPRYSVGPSGQIWRPGWLPENRLALTLVLVYLFSPFLTGILNSASTYSGGRFLPGLTLYDAASFASTHAVQLLPFLLGRRYLADPQSHRLILKCLVIGGLAYTIPILIEVRLSPQLHTWVYGFFPHSFAQQLRFGGFRPVVFQVHGLRVAMFVALTLLAAIGLWRSSKGTLRSQMMLVIGWLSLTLILCKTVGALFLAALMAPVIAFAGSKLLRAALVTAAMTVIMFPLLRGLDFIPTDILVSTASVISEDRAASLQFRFDNEDILLERANQQALYGWGGWSRNRVFNETGQDVSTTDGTWIITIGAYGWIGYLAEFGLLVVGVIFLASTKTGRYSSYYSMALAALICTNLLDLLPNSGLTPLTWMMAGATLGSSDLLTHRTSSTVTDLTKKVKT